MSDACAAVGRREGALDRPAVTHSLSWSLFFARLRWVSTWTTLALLFVALGAVLVWLRATDDSLGATLFVADRLRSHHLGRQLRSRHRAHARERGTSDARDLSLAIELRPLRPAGSGPRARRCVPGPRRKRAFGRPHPGRDALRPGHRPSNPGSGGLKSRPDQTPGTVVTFRLSCYLPKAGCSCDFPLFPCGSRRSPAPSVVNRRRKALPPRRCCRCAR